MSFIEVQDISKTFKVNKRKAGIPGMIANMFVPKYEYKEAVKKISFNIEEGEMVGFIGPNGAGKSTTIKMLSGILCPDEGNISVGGYVPYKQRKDYVANIGVVFGQKSQLQWDLPVIDSFELLKAIYRIPEDKYKKNLNRFTDMLDMGGFIDQPVRQLSLGQRMRSDIVASLLHSPEIVFGECRLNEFLFCQDVFHIARKDLIEFDFQNMFIQGLNGNTEVSPAEKVIKVIGH